MDTPVRAQLRHTQCSADGCERVGSRRGLCRLHYDRFRRHGYPPALPLRRGAPGAFIDAAILTDTDDCISWPFALDGRGYAQIKLGRPQKVSRVICERIHGAAPLGKNYAAHSCGNGHKGCINPKHLRWATPKENVADRIAHGTHGRGERNSAAKLTANAVRTIRSQADKAARDLATEFGVGAATIRDIRARRSWSWL